MSEKPSTLDELPIGVSAVVRSVDRGRQVRRRLLELGLLPGTRIEVIRRAPLGDPLELSLRGYRLSIRADEARAIGVAREAIAVNVVADAFIAKRA